MYSVDLHLIPSKDESTTADESTTSDESTEDGLTDCGLIADSESEDDYALASTSEASPVDNQDDCTWEYNFSENAFHPLRKQGTRMESSDARAKRLAAVERQRLYHKKWRARMSTEQVQRFHVRKQEYQRNRRKNNPGIDKRLNEARSEENKRNVRDRRAA